MNLKDTTETLDLLESLDINDEYAYERALLIFLKLGGIPIFIHDIPASESFFHARTHGREDFFNRISDISAPPKEYVQSFARCNRPFQSVFYCSTTRPTSFMELVEYWAKSREIGGKLKVTLGLWELKKPIQAVIITSPNPEDRISEYDKLHGAAFDRTMSKYTGEELESQKVFYQYLFEKFRKPAKNDLKTYLITSAYCNVALMHANGQADAVYYPSVPFKGNGINLCINNSFFKEENISLILAIRNEFTITENDKGKHTFTETDKIETANINFEADSITW